MPNSEYPQLLVLKEKFGDRYFLLSSQRDYELVATKIMLERIRDGYYPKYNSIEDLKLERDERIEDLLTKSKDASLLALSDEEVESLPEALKKSAEEARIAHADRKSRLWKHYEQELRMAERFQALKNSPSPQDLTHISPVRKRTMNLAIMLFENFAGEYEEHEFEYLNGAPTEEELKELSGELKS